MDLASGCPVLLRHSEALPGYPWFLVLLQGPSLGIASIVHPVSIVPKLCRAATREALPRSHGHSYDTR